jgi:membrane protein YqaA with SNARE-associated domain
MARGQWLRLAFAGCVAAAVLGGIVGYSLGRWASNRANAPWLSVLPWSHGAKKRSARSAALTLSVSLSQMIVVLGWVITSTLGQPDPLLSGLIAGGVANWRVRQILALLVSSGRHAVILSTHMVETVAAACTEVIFLEGGKMTHRWGPEQLRAAQAEPGGFNGLVMRTLEEAETNANPALSR